MLPRSLRPLGVLLLFLVGLSAEGQAQLSLPNLSTPALNLMRLDRLMAPGLTIGAESNLDDRHGGYIQATIPLKGKLGLGLDLGAIGNVRRPLDVVDVLKPDIRQRFLDLGISYTAWPLGARNTQAVTAYVGFSGLRYTGHRGFLIWSLRGQFAEDLPLYDQGVGIRASAATGYAKFAKAGLLWYAGAYLAYDDGLWVPVPWVGAQARLPHGHRIRILLPREVQYRYRFGKGGLLKPARWEMGLASRVQLDRFGDFAANPFVIDPPPATINTTVLSLRSGAWLGVRPKGGRVWLQLHGGYAPAWVGSEGSTIWGFMANEMIPARWSYGYAELRIVADLGKDWLGLDLGNLLVP